MTFVETGFPGLVIVEPRIFTDARGYFYECYNETAFAEAGISCRFVQDNQSKSQYGVVRGLHCQRGLHAQAKLVRVLHGAVLDVVVDIRRGSPTRGKHFSVELSGGNSRQLFVPRGFLHGFSVLSDAAVLHYKCDNFYNGDSETGVRYDDPELGIDWRIPADRICLSEKDACLPGFGDAAYYGE